VVFLPSLDLNKIPKPQHPNPTHLNTSLSQPLPLHTPGESHDMGDAEWIVIRAQLWGHNDTPCGRLAPGRLIGQPGVGRPQGVFGGFSYYQLVMIFLNIVPLIMKFTSNIISFSVPNPNPTSGTFRVTLYNVKNYYY
jgi:hypothetical protein